MSAQANNAASQDSWRKFGTRALGNLAIRVTGLVLLLAQAVLLARIMGPAGYGFVAMLLAAIQIGATVLLFGLGPYAIATVPPLLQDNARSEAYGLLTFSSKLVLAGGALAILVVLTIAQIWSDPAHYWPIVLATISAPAMALIQLNRGHAQGQQRIIWSQLPGEVLRPLPLVVLLTIGLIGLHIGFVEFFAAFAISAWIAALIGAKVVRSQYRATAPSPVSSRKWLIGAVPFLGIMLVNMLQLQTATLALGFIDGTAAAGLYQPLARVAIVLALPAYILAMSFSPTAAKLLAQNDRKAAARLSRRYAITNLAAVALLGLAISLLGEPILALFGPEFTSAAPWLPVLAIGFLANALSGPAHVLLSMGGHSRAAFQGTAIGLALEVCILALLVPYLGILGAVISVSLGMLARGIIHAFFCNRLLRLSVKDFFLPGRADQ